MICLGTSVDCYPSGYGLMAKAENWPLVVELLERAEVPLDKLEVNDSLFEGKKYLVRRMDDNGIEFDVATFDDPLSASLKANEYSRGIHKQTYWMEEVS